jgi:hypothetical protein
MVDNNDGRPLGGEAPMDIERIGAAQAQDVQLAVQYATFKQVAELQKAMTAQLFQSLGIGQNVDLEA